MEIFTFYPSGNLTALVCYRPKETEKMVIEEKIFQIYPQIEQVWFIYLEDNIYKLEMTHGELCVNAILSYLCYLDLYMSVFDTEIYLVWPNYKIRGIKSSTQEYTVYFPDIYQAQFLSLDSVDIVDMKGIKHIYIEYNSTDFIPNLNYQICILKHQSVEWVSGVNWVENKDWVIILHPYIFYHSNHRVTYETSCSSWSIGLVVSKVFKENITHAKTWEIQQLSWEYIRINSCLKNGVLSCRITNTVVPGWVNFSIIP